MSGGQFPLNAKALGRRPTRCDRSARSAQNWDRLHSEDPGHLAPEISESACRAVAGFWKTLYKSAGIFCNGAHLLALNMVHPTSKVPGRGVWGHGQRAPQRGIFKGAGAPLNGLLLPFLPTRKGRAGRGLGARPEPPPTPGPARSKKYPCWGFGGPPNRTRHYASKNSALSGQDTKPPAR